MTAQRVPQHTCHTSCRPLCHSHTITLFDTVIKRVILYGTDCFFSFRALFLLDHCLLLLCDIAFSLSLTLSAFQQLVNGHHPDLSLGREFIRIYHASNCMVHPNQSNRFETIPLFTSLIRFKLLFTISEELSQGNGSALCTHTHSKRMSM